ncbi:MAG: hypothetical protein OEY56_05895 [Cyclobacteriaceae bacterium]|nr:hypothetical protein [Cyclobacteriaceae bacterium]
MNTYQLFLSIHSIVRWIALILLLVVFVKSITGLLAKNNYGKLDNILSASSLGFIHLQVLIGLVLYLFLSPSTDLAFQDFGKAMKDSLLRFWAVEHLIMMLLAAVLIHVGRIKSKKAASDRSRFRQQAIFYGLGLLLILLGIPWNRFGI